MNGRFDLRRPVHSRALILVGFVFAVGAVSCGEKLEAGAACPLL